MKKMKGNKGAALISVLIGVMFITILGASLLYMAMTNYKIKVMRMRSTDNFYTCEFALNDIAAFVCEFVEEKKDADELETLLKDTAGAYNIYKLDVVENMITVANEGQLPGVESVSVNCVYRGSDGTYSQSSYSRSGGNITLKGLQVTVTMDEEHGAYTNTITTDLQFQFPIEPNGDFDINDFSILSDSAVSVTQCSQIFSGCLYMKQAGNPYNFALRVGTNGLVYSLGKFCFIDGDVKVVDGGALIVAGDMYVNGDVSIATGSSLYVTGKLYIRGNLNLGTASCDRSESGHIFHDGLNATNAATTESGASTGVNWKYYCEKTATMGLCNQMVVRQFPLPNGTMQEINSFLDSHVGTASQTQKSSANLNGKDITVFFRMQNQSMTGGYHNALIFCAQGFELSAEVENSCYLNIGSANLLDIRDGSSMNYWGTMSDEDFEAAKTIFYFREDPGNGSGLNGNYTSMYNHMTTANVYDKATLAANGVTGVADGEFRVYPVLGGTQYEKVEIYATIGSGSNVQNYYRTVSPRDGNGVGIYFSAGCLINPSSSAILSEFAANGSSGGAADAAPVVRFINWTKE